MVYKLRVLFTAVALMLGVPALTALAETYPEKPVTFIVPWPPGGRTDLTARLTAQFLAETLGRPVVIVNHTGASGVAGAKKVATANPDGYTLGVFSSGVVATQYTVPTPSDLKEYEPISLINMDAAALAVPHLSPYKNLQDFVAHARNNPMKVKLGMSPGTATHVMSAVFAKAAGVNFLLVPMGGGGVRSVALAGNHIDVDVDVPAIYKNLIDASKVRLLGLGSEKRSALFADVPTLREQGVDCVIGTWNGLFAPKGTPNHILSTLDKALEKVANNPRYVETMHKALLEVRYMNREEFAQFLAKEDAGTRQITKELNLQEPRK